MRKVVAWDLQPSTRSGIANAEYTVSLFPLDAVFGADFGSQRHSLLVVDKTRLGHLHCLSLLSVSSACVGFRLPVMTVVLA